MIHLATAVILVTTVAKMQFTLQLPCLEKGNLGLNCGGKPSIIKLSFRALIDWAAIEYLEEGGPWRAWGWEKQGCLPFARLRAAPKILKWQQKGAKAYSTRYSQAVSHPSTNQA